MKELRPPSGYPPPSTGRLATGRELELAPLAKGVCRRYRAEFTDEEERYGSAGHAWCVHDNVWLLYWAIADVELGEVSFREQLDWLANVLAAREFPLERLARDLEIAASEVERQIGSEIDAVAGLLRREASALRSRLPL